MDVFGATNKYDKNSREFWKDTTANNIQINQLGFESVADLNGWNAVKGSIEISPRHFKDGQKSLLWNWVKGDFLKVSQLDGLDKASAFYAGGIPEFYEPAFYPKSRYGGIKMWLYQEEVQDGRMIFQIGSSIEAARKDPKYKFEVNLNFTGWRAVWVNLEEDAKVSNYSGSDVMKSLISYPSKELKGSGQLYIDHLTLLTFVSNKRHSDLQFKNHKHNYRQADSYEILEPYEKFINANYPTLLLNTKELEVNSKTIADKLEFLILGDKSGDWKKRETQIEKVVHSTIKSSLSYYNKLQLHRNNGFINGVPLFATRDEHPAKEGLVFQAAAQSVTFPLAMDYKLNGKIDSKEKLIDVLDYLEDQGWAAGSAMGTVDHVIRLNAIANSIFLIRDELKSRGKLKSRIDMLAWHTRMGTLLSKDYSKGENTDKVRGGALVKLITILLMENNSTKAGLLKDFKTYMDYVISIAPGYSDTMKPDYSVYHHRGTYLNSYGIQSINTMALIHWLLEGTPYAFSENSIAILKKTLVKQSQIAFGTDLHYGVSGRFPDQNSAIGRFLLPAYAFMSMQGNAVMDERLAERFSYLYSITNPKEITSILLPALTYSGTFGTLDLMVRLHQKMGNKMDKPKDGNYTMPYSSLSVHRKGKAYAAVKGYNKYIWDFETGSSNGENSLGRYLSFGFLLVAQNNEKEGFEGAGIDMNDGYQWAFLPGATTKALPIEKVFFNNKGTEKYIEGYHRSFSKTAFANGLTQEGKNGVYAMELRDDVGPDKEMVLFDSTFRAKKSYFFIGDEIICLGSTINNVDKRYNTVTTLFQYKLNKDYSTFYNGKSLGASLSVNQKVKGGYFTDQNGLHYIIDDSQDIIIEQNEQHSLKRNGQKYEKIISPHVKAYLNHGSAPKDAQYDYQIILNTSKDGMKPFLENKTYEVLTKNAEVHSIYHKGTGISAYAIFSSQKNLQKGPILATDTPILAMFKEPGEYSVLTVANPDIQLESWNHNMSRMPDNIVNGSSKGSIVTITLKGLWYSAKAVHDLQSLTHQNGNSVLKIYCKDGKSVNIPLQRR